jgi:hypothetical protein
MQNHFKTIGALAAAAALVAGNTQAEVEYLLHTGYSSEYLWRGQDLGNALVEAGVDASTTWNGVGLSAGAWYGSFENTGSNVDELDLYGEASKDFGFLKGSIGYIAYQYPNSNADTAQEVYFGVSHDFGFADVSLKYFWDVEVDNDGYTELGLSRAFEINPCLSLNVGTNVGYLIEEGDCTAWTTKVALDWGFAEHAKLSPFVAFSVALSDEPTTLYAGSSNELVGGCMLSVSF